MQFQKGQSGNPNGRPKGVERIAREMADQLAGGEPFAGLRAVMKLAYERMTDPKVDDKDRRGWAQLYVERAYGKPRESVDLTFDHEQPEAPIDWSQVPLEQRQRLLAALDEIDALAKLAGASGGGEH